MRNLVIGARGLLGSAFVRAFKRRGEYVATTGFGENYTHYFELSYPEDIYQIMEDEQPERVFLCAYNAWVDAAEWDDTVFQTNVSGNLHAALAAKFVGAKVYFPSSSYVFDGTKALPYLETDHPKPINIYGQHKLLLERLLLESLSDPVIFRTVGLFGPEKEERKNFVYQVIDGLTQGEIIEAPVDQVMNPIHVDSLVKAVLSLPKDFSGIIHIAGDKICSKYQWAYDIATEYGAWNDRAQIEGTKTRYEDQKANRPANGSLDCGKLVELIGYPPSIGLEDFLEEIK